MSEHTPDYDALREEAKRASAIYDELLTQVQAAPVGAIARRLHSALGDLAHVALTRATPPAEGGADKRTQALTTTLCSECERPGQCAACYLMECKGLPTPLRVIPPAKTEGDS